MASRNRNHRPARKPEAFYCTYLFGLSGVLTRPAGTGALPGAREWRGGQPHRRRGVHRCRHQGRGGRSDGTVSERHGARRLLRGGGVWESQLMTRTYRMTAARSDAWWSGCTEVIEQEIHEDLQDDGNTADVDVLLDDGSIAFTIWQEV